MNNLASLYMDQGKFAKAEPLLVKTLEVSRRVLGEEHPDTLESSACENNLAESLMSSGSDRGNCDRSDPDLYSRSVARLRGRRSSSLGPDHPDTLNTMANLGVNYRDAGRLPEGTALLEQAWAKARKQPGPLVDDLAWIPRALGEAYDQAGQFAKAEPLYREALEAARKRHGEASLQSADVLGSLGLQLAQAAEIRRGRAAAPRVPEDPRAERSRTTGRRSTRSPCSAAACWARRSTPRPSRCSWPATRG